MADYDYDLFVIGAGSGGVRASRIAASHGAKVAVQVRRVVFQVAVVGKHPVEAPQLAHERVAVFQLHLADGIEFLENLGLRIDIRFREKIFKFRIKRKLRIRDKHFLAFLGTLVHELHLLEMIDFFGYLRFPQQGFFLQILERKLLFRVEKQQSQ